MREEHNEKLFLEQEKAAAASGAPAPKKEEKPRKKVGFITVSIGEGINEIFSGLGVDYIIEGGQTMNPSTQDMLNAIDEVNADTVFILPNNKNIILAADQARAMTEGKNIVVIPSKTIPQGIAAVISYIEGKTDEENEALMREAMKNIKTGQVTYSVRDTSIDGKEIKTGDYMGLDDHTIQSVGTSLYDTTIGLIESMLDEDSELLSIYYGQDASEEEAQRIADKIASRNNMIDIEVHSGGQPIYYYIASVE